ncbi:MAG: hypothetical protein H7Y01_15090 [Ferruginibacter sp.]|nr:hypothetical protein [Chitinophagaceae bacterium]
MQQPELWNKIKSFQLDDPLSAYTFTERLERENRWPLSYAFSVVEEYKKFIYLLCIAKHPLTPSDQIDQAWHLHLIYTQSYWIDFCKNVIGRELHHGPTKGGQLEKTKFNNWYQLTKELYAKEFSQNPPTDIWPDNETRFKDINFQRINIDKVWLIRNPFSLRKK